MKDTIFDTHSSFKNEVKTQKSTTDSQFVNITVDCVYGHAITIMSLPLEKFFNKIWQFCF